MMPSNARRAEFRADFRSRRLLAIDDLQHMPADDFVWQELRFFLDAFEDSGGTVIITASEPISTLPNISPDIRSRLSAGLRCSSLRLQAPARTRIVQQASDALGRPLADDASTLGPGINGTARRFQRCFRTPVAANAKLAAIRSEPMHSRFARRQSTDDLPDFGRRRPPLSIPQKQLKSQSRRQSIVYARGGRLPRPRISRSQLRTDRPGPWRSRPHHDHPQLSQNRRERPMTAVQEATKLLTRNHPESVTTTC